MDMTIDKKNIDVLPCPKCGKKPSVAHHPGTVYAECVGCGIKGDEVIRMYHSTEQETEDTLEREKYDAYSKWNDKEKKRQNAVHNHPADLTRDLQMG
ncbi:Lar family restriction alleviation protein [Acidithiobacillus ferriphilus]|uniref:Lar family restriction alleviation protein n=1 Tax=Acidithiobacillus ferriphilus TaxID=1689834 RepID=UPI001C07C849|nr:Lar family restriction alleviation protein [Acidithiobacillus ferriphilus]MBU2853329.1 hypothetical protein [Acidithiobacillus ferriphilus]